MPRRSPFVITLSRDERAALEARARKYTSPDRRRHIPEICATALDECFGSECQEVARYGEYVLLWRKGGPIPPLPK